MNANIPDWPIANPADLGVNRSILDGELTDLMGQHKTGAAALVVRGRLVWEKYWPPFDAAKRFDTMSIAKAFAALAIGLLQDDSLLSVDDFACKYLPEWAGDGRSQITIRHLLTMTSGLQLDYESFSKDPDPTRAALRTPLAHLPGEVWCYEQATSQALCPIIQRVSGKQPIDLLQDRLLNPIGAGAIGWTRAASGDCLTWRSVLSNARDLAKVGWLMHEGGQWNGRQLISRDFISRMTRRDVLEENARIHEGQQDFRRWNYAWNLFVNAENIWEGVHAGCYAPLGAYGNMCLVDTHKHFVFIRLSTPEGDPQPANYGSPLDVTDKGTALAWRTVLKAF